MSNVYFITHPEVDVDPEIPVPKWRLSELGRRRLQDLLRQPWINEIKVVYSSEEEKSHEAGEIIARHGRIPHIALPELGEVDRSSTGYLEDDEHDRAVAQLFGAPEVSYRGWEPARDAQKRIVRALQFIDEDVPREASLAVVSHGGVGTLLLCYVKAVQISREEAGAGQGNYFSFRRGTWDLVHGWRPISHDKL